ncbi:Sodium/potassium/calcium exchanger 6, mitochondrial [Liparis tanakae]|uniref:Sodium/potassium/calcium exchanger 6, mitochondrial n=1 Tax=Liparis tanakae TaxID=230148 RepID=A0A4Z2FPW4_9TELE|nr:Sodium/potassium/calcium exchanger 6, mitochondrial [Liparis tanakae]
MSPAGYAPLLLLALAQQPAAARAPLDNTALRDANDQCDLVMNLSAAARCAFVKNTPDCNMEHGFINYLQLAFCLLPPGLTPLTITLCNMWEEEGQ